MRNSEIKTQSYQSSSMRIFSENHSAPLPANVRITYDGTDNSALEKAKNVLISYYAKNVINKGNINGIQ